MIFVTELSESDFFLALYVYRNHGWMNRRIYHILI